MRHGWRRAARAVQHVRCASSHVRPAERLAQYDWRRAQSLAQGGPDSRADVVDVVRHVRSKDPRASHLAKPVSYTHLTLPTTIIRCRYRW